MNDANSKNLGEIEKHHKDTVSFRSSTTKYEKEHGLLISKVKEQDLEIERWKFDADTTREAHFCTHKRAENAETWRDEYFRLLQEAEARIEELRGEADVEFVNKAHEALGRAEKAEAELARQNESVALADGHIKRLQARVRELGEIALIWIGSAQQARGSIFGPSDKVDYESDKQRVYALQHNEGE